MGSGASSSPKQSVQHADKTSTSSNQGHSFTDSKPSAGAVMRAPWGSCVLSLHVASLFSKMDFDVSQNIELGCLHSVAARCSSEGAAHQLSGVQSVFAAAHRELGLLQDNVLKEQDALFKDAAEKLEDFHEFAQTYARIFCNDHIRSTFQKKKSHTLVRSCYLRCSCFPPMHFMLGAHVPRSPVAAW